MPEMTGIKLAETLRGRGISTPIVIVTGRNDPRLAPRMLRAGVNAVLSKPVDEEKLLACIRDAGQSN
jgi:two-component system response regulator FixJ